jgi:hypothetical protein
MGGSPEPASIGPPQGSGGRDRQVHVHPTGARRVHPLADRLCESGVAHPSREETTDGSEEPSVDQRLSSVEVFWRLTLLVASWRDTGVEAFENPRSRRSVGNRSRRLHCRVELDGRSSRLTVELISSPMIMTTILLVIMS